MKSKYFVICLPHKRRWFVPFSWFKFSTIQHCLYSTCLSIRLSVCLSVYTVYLSTCWSLHVQHQQTFYQLQIILEYVSAPSASPSWVFVVVIVNDVVQVWRLGSAVHLQCDVFSVSLIALGVTLSSPAVEVFIRFACA